MMRNRTFAKDIVRSITHSWGRFWAIFAIVALGAGFFAGLRATGPDMQLTGDTYFDDTRLMDIELLSTLGFTDDDITAISQKDNVENVMAVHRFDVLSEINGEKQVIRIHGLPEDTNPHNGNYLNRPLLIEGRLPENSGECVVGTGKINTGTPKLGSVITLEDSDGTLGDNVKHRQYTVVGLVNSSYYISFTLGNTTLGNGTISYYMYIPDSDFTQEVYTNVFVTVDGARQLSCFSPRYEKLVSRVADSFSALAEQRKQIRYDEIMTKAQNTLAEAQSDYNEAKAEAEEKLSEALLELQDAQAQIEENEQKLKDAKAAIDAGTRKLRHAKETLDEKERELGVTRTQLTEGLSELERGKSAYLTHEETYADSLLQWQNASDAIAAGLKALDEAEEAAAGDPDALAQIALQRKTLFAQQAQLMDQKALLDANRQFLDKLQAELALTEQRLAEGQVVLEAGQAQLTEAKKELEDGQAQLRRARKQYVDGLAKINDAKKELQEGWADYEQAKAEADTQLRDAQADIDEGYDKLRELEPPEWYILDRNDNVGYASFKSDTERMDSLSSVFPVIFFLVAALVSLTTMTRMVDEERLIIGTYKALGYSNARIASKYLIYALLASVSGGILGVIVGFRTLPEVCWGAYQMMYTAPELINQFNLKFALLGCAAATLCTLAATASVCRTALASQPAALMLPLAPKSGKRIWLERIPFIWKRLTFTRKVTCRNLFRYKKRLIMTIVGIAGCTGLLLTGFGIKDSISSILDYQYDDICQYDTTIALSEDEVSVATMDLLDAHFSDWMAVGQHTADVYTQDGERFLSSYIFVPENAQRISEFISLHERVSKERVPFGSNAVVLTEKFANSLEVYVGDDVLLKDEEGKLVPFTVTGITENYVFHYVYIDPALYEQKMGKPPTFNTVIAYSQGADEAARREISEALRNEGSVSIVTYSADLREKFEDMIQTLNYIVVVLIVSAGALAFVVLYNLTNINITERRRELATIKVLGFYDREVSAYIYRETSLLTLIGCVLGLGLGVLLHAFVIKTIEVDNVMFGRDIAFISYIWSMLLTFGFSLIVDVFMAGKLKSISMIDNLKSVD